MRIETKEDVRFANARFIELKNKLVNKYSPAETKFTDLLTKSGLYFVREKCNFKIGTRWAYFDFFLPYYGLYVEIDGESHNSEEQKAIDKEKEEIIKRKGRFIARLTNDEVLGLESVTIGYLLQRMCEYKVSQRKRHRNIESCLTRYWKVHNNETYGARTSLIHEFGDCVEKDREVWMYDDRIGEYFSFRDLYEAKLATGLKMKVLLDLVEMEEYKKCSARVHILAYTKDECIQRVYSTYGW